MTFNREAKKAFLDFATSPDATWRGNFRDFSAAIERMATLAPGGRITKPVVDAEIDRLRERWRAPSRDDDDARVLQSVLGPDAVDDLDLFDRVQLAELVRVCRGARTLSDAGRQLFAASLRRRTSTNDADRLRKYLAKFELTWATITGA